MDFRNKENKLVYSGVSMFIYYFLRFVLGPLTLLVVLRPQAVDVHRNPPPGHFPSSAPFFDVGFVFCTKIHSFVNS